MAWFRLDDGFADHPKVLRCSLAAIGLWTKAGAWSAKHLTDGEIPQAAVGALGGSPKLVRELVVAGLWIEHGDGYAFHEWADHQPSRDQVLAKRAATRARVTRCRAPKNAVGNGVTDSATNDSRNTSPVPSRPEEASQLAESLDSHSACDAWHAALEQPNGAPMGTKHGHGAWREHFETVAAVVNGAIVPERRQEALRVLCEWFWLAPDGPVQSKRVPRRMASPKNLATYVNTDLDRALAWHEQRQAAQ